MIALNIPVMVENTEVDGELVSNDETVYIILDGEEIEVDGYCDFESHYPMYPGKTYIGVQTVELEDEFFEVETSVYGSYRPAQWNVSPEEYPEVEIGDITLDGHDVSEFVEYDSSDFEAIEEAALEPVDNW